MIYSRHFFIAVFLTFTAANISAQCPNDNTISFSPPTNMTPAGAGQTVTNCCVWGGEYVEVNVSTGNNYTFSTCLNNSYDTHLTLRRNSDGGLLAANNDGCNVNRSTITWTATMTGLTRLILDQGGACASNGTNTEVRVTLNSVTPVLWSHFEIDLVEDGIRLDWATQFERNVVSFNIERSADGVKFEKLAFIPAIGNSDLPTGYGWTDKAPLAGLNYYRISENSDDGSVAHHPEIRTLFYSPEPNFLDFAIYPNPAAIRARVQAHIDSASPTKLELFELNGRRLKVIDVASGQAFLDQSLPLNGLPAGTYIVQLTQNEHSIKKRLIVAQE